MDVLFGVWFGMPIWVWLGFIGLVLTILYVDLAVLHQDAHEVGIGESAVMAAVCMALAVAFSGVVWYLYFTGINSGALDPTIGGQPTPDARAWTAWKLYMTGWVVEQTLAFDNIFVISMIFGYFAIPPKYQHRVLFWGIIGVIVLRALMIGAGAALLQQFHWLLYVFSAFLVFTGIKMLLAVDHKPDMDANPLLRFMRARMRITDHLHGERFVVRQADPATGKPVLWATPLLVCLVLIEFADLIFAVDSVPAIFALTTDPFLVYTSNIFAIMGLRSLYFVLAAMVHRFHYLKYALSLVLIYIGAKIFAQELIGKIAPEISLAVTFGLLGGGVLLSLWSTRGQAKAPADVGR
jgi:tellurite resistance protein TerC